MIKYPVKKDHTVFIRRGNIHGTDQGLFPHNQRHVRSFIPASSEEETGKATERKRSRIPGT